MSSRKKRIIEYRHYSLPANFPVLLLSGKRWKISPIRSNRLHFHNCLEIGICYSDSGIMEFEGESIPFRAGDITCVPRHLAHTTYSAPNTESQWAYIFVDPDELFRTLFRSSNSNFERPFSTLKFSKFIMNKVDYPKVYTLATTIVDELKRQNHCYQESVQGLMISLYIDLIRINSIEATQINPITKHALDHVISISPALDYIYSNYMTQISISNLAHLCNLSETHFRRTFQNIMNTTPLNFLNSTRIEEACKLLRSTDDSILSISEKVGFRSISSFNRYFSKLLVNTPRDWRKEALQLDNENIKTSILEFIGF